MWPTPSPSPWSLASATGCWAASIGLCSVACCSAPLPGIWLGTHVSAKVPGACPAPPAGFHADLDRRQADRRLTELNFRKTTMYRNTTISTASSCKSASPIQRPGPPLAGRELTNDEFRPCACKTASTSSATPPCCASPCPTASLSQRPVTPAGLHRPHLRPGLRPLHDPPQHAVQLAEDRGLPDIPPIWPRSRCTPSRRPATHPQITTDQFAGVAADEVIDPRPWPKSSASGAPSTRNSPFAAQVQDRHFRHAAGPRRHVVPRHRPASGRRRWRNGFRVIVGGGLGRTPIRGQVVREFLPWQHTSSPIAKPFSGSITATAAATTPSRRASRFSCSPWASRNSPARSKPNGSTSADGPETSPRLNSTASPPISAPRLRPPAGRRFSFEQHRTTTRPSPAGPTLRPRPPGAGLRRRHPVLKKHGQAPATSAPTRWTHRRSGRPLQLRRTAGFPRAKRHPFRRPEVRPPRRLAGGGQWV